MAVVEDKHCSKVPYREAGEMAQWLRAQATLHAICPNLKKMVSGAGEMAQWLRAPTALLKVLSSNPSNHMVAHNHP